MSSSPSPEDKGGTMSGKRAGAYSGEPPRLLFAGVVGLLLLLVWILDIVSGPRLTISLFYLLPVGLSAWFLGLWAGFIVAGVSVGAWLFTELSTNVTLSEPLVPYLNAAIRLGFFLVVAYGVSTLRAARTRQAELTTFIIHDLRSPLASIMVSLQLLREGNGPASRSPEKDRQALEIGLKSAYYMESLIDSLLDLARLEAGRMPLQHEEVAAEELLAQAMDQVALIAGRQRVDLQLQSEGEQTLLSVDRALTVRVLVNLLSNAISYSPGEATVTLRARPYEGQMFLFRIQDEGPGIPQEWQRKAFQKFEQVRARRAGIAVGSGLGLAYCRMAVEAQSGKIWIEQSSDTGAVLCFTLPLAETTADGEDVAL
ncbi:MAG TPA: HAMP domain-containing sensor histidine kinase [Candidatus Sulfomarinibacteraceae bacterium]|nr:HAMP domain-containing sensor histidine kinase [Candidatus Sulfomarinibacteraceae bacterium]